MMKSLMILSNPFTHDARVYEEAKTLVKADHKVTVIGWDRRAEHPIDEIIDGIEIIRTRNNAYMKLLLYDIFRLKLWWRQVYKIAKNLHAKKGFDVVHCHDFDTLPIGVKLKKNLGVRLIYDAHEIWGYMVAATLPKWLANRFLQKERTLAPFADKIITVAEPHEKYFREMGCRNVTLVRSCKRLEKSEYKPPSNDIITLIYIGRLCSGRFILEAIDICKELDNIRFLIAGFGPLEKQIKERAASSPSIEFLGKLHISEIIPLTRKADIVHCVLDPSKRNNQVGPPNKVFEAMVAGRPVLVTKGIYSGKLVERNNMGLAVKYNKTSYRTALTKFRDNAKLREQLGKKALEIAKKEYNWAAQKSKLLKIYNELEGL